MEARMIYITCRDQAEARTIGRAMVSERLAACANILSGMSSVYRWEGALVEDQECVLILKTRAVLVPTLIERACALHSYEVPCVLALPVEAGNPAYVQWIETETL
ncbi:MAG: divalent-cation tolerance protein CutA [Bacteroidia bacterium]